jgi:hypothetical protein
MRFDLEGSQPLRIPTAFRSSPPPTPDEELERFAALQSKLLDRWEKVRSLDAGRRYIVVVPSLSLEGMAYSSVAGFNHYEERMLFTLAQLRHARARIVYLTSQPLHPAMIDYVIAQISGIPSAHVRERVSFLTCHDATPKPLTEKILERPRLIERIRRAIDPERAYMICFSATHRERSLAVRVGIPLYGLDPELVHLGTKSGSRKVFRAAGIPFPAGVEDVRSEREVGEAIADMWEADPAMRRVMVKHDDGFSGEGNASLDLERLALTGAKPGHASHSGLVEAVVGALPHMRFFAKHQDWPNFRNRMQALGGVVEAFVEGADKQSPSAQLRINPRGELTAISTHDQILAADGQTYLGCRFPAAADYRMTIQEDALKVGAVLREKGVIGRSAVDFVTFRNADGTWGRSAIEINLRMSGTTHPLMLMKLVNDGKYDARTGVFRTRRGEERCYVASDSLLRPEYKGLAVEDLLDIAAVHGLHYRPWTDSGVIFQLTGALSQFGKVGITCIGATQVEAQQWFDATQTALDREVGLPPGLLSVPDITDT